MVLEPIVSLRFLSYATILAAIWLPSGAVAEKHFIPDCAGHVEIAHAHVVRVEQNGVLVLEDGHAVMLKSIRLPGANGAPRDLAQRALSRLWRWRGARARLRRPKDRMTGCGRRPSAKVAKGRPRAAGLCPRRQAMSGASDGRFQTVEGWGTGVGQNGRRVFIDFGGDGQQVFSTVIQPEDRRAFRGFDVDGLEAFHVHVLGIVQDYRGRPRIELSPPWQIEVLN